MQSNPFFPPKPDAPPIGFRPSAAARAIGVSPRKLWQLTREGRVPHLKLGRCVVYPRDLLLQWMAKEAEATRRNEGGVT